MSMRSPQWPAPPDRVATARELLRELGAQRARVIVAPHGDVDGLASGVLAIRALERIGATPIVCLPGKGEHVHTPAMRTRLAALDAAGLIVLDMGSRAGPIVRGLPTIVLDHHDAQHVPDEVVYVSAAGHEPVAPTALLAYEVLRALAPLDDLAWLAWMGVVGDLGINHPFAAELPVTRYRKTHVQKAVSLVNAARRAGNYRPEIALEVLLAAREPIEIARGTTPGVDELVACREEVSAELARVARTAPKLIGDVAVIRFSSPAQIHPLIATRWTTRLAPRIVLAANDGYLPGRVNFAMRSASSTDLLAFLRNLGLGDVEGEFANGHPRATGGSIPPSEFDRLLRALEQVTNPKREQRGHHT
jgi:single-stranded-DNA-specific exonuclease